MTAISKLLCLVKAIRALVDPYFSSSFFFFLASFLCVALSQRPLNVSPPSINPASAHRSVAHRLALAAKPSTLSTLPEPL